MSGMNPTLGSTFMVHDDDHRRAVGHQGVQLDGHDVARQSALPRADAERRGLRGDVRDRRLSGVFMAATPIDMHIHDTYFIVAHLHYVLFGGSLFALFAGITYWFPKMFGKMMNEPIGKIHFWLTMLFFNLTFFPMHILGMAGHMRRIYDPTQYEWLKGYQPMNHFISLAAFALFASQFLFIGTSCGACSKGKRRSRTRGADNGLEWTLPNPAPHGNWEKIPTVYRGPYEYSLPGAPDDWYPQSSKLPNDREPAPAPAPAH